MHVTEISTCSVCEVEADYRRCGLKPPEGLREDYIRLRQLEDRDRVRQKFWNAVVTKLSDNPRLSERNAIEQVQEEWRAEGLDTELHYNDRRV